MFSLPSRQPLPLLVLLQTISLKPTRAKLIITNINMKLNSTLLAMLAMLLYLTLSSAESNEENCAKNRAKTHQAIREFCNPAIKIMAPSEYAKHGKTVGDVQVHIHGGECSPPQYVPQHWCLVQFYAMCRNKVAIKHHGNNNCQEWRITKPSSLIGKRNETVGGFEWVA